MLLVAVGSFVLLIIVVYLVAAPVARGAPAEEATEASALLVRKERLLSDIRDLDMDLVTGKLDEEDHRGLRVALLGDAAETLKALEEAEPTAPGGPSDALGPQDAIEADEDARVEALIAARRRAIESSACSSCGGGSDAEDVFCRRCGADLWAQRVG